MAHHDRSNRERDIALAEEGGLSASTAGELYGVPNSTAGAWLQKYQRDGQVGRLRGTGLWRVSNPAQDAALVVEAQRNLFVSAVRLAFAESHVDRKWDRVIFSEESTFISANDGPVLVYRPREERYNSQYLSCCTRSSRVSALFWGWISHEGAGLLHRIDGHLDCLLYKHILLKVMVPSVHMLYPDGIIHFQQVHSSIYYSHVVQECLSLHPTSN